MLVTEKTSLAHQLLGDVVGYVKLEELLVEETWLEALPGEFQKPYAKNLCRFVEKEFSGGVPIYPPQHLIFNALNTTSFDRVKAVIIGQCDFRIRIMGQVRQWASLSRCLEV